MANERGSRPTSQAPNKDNAPTAGSSGNRLVVGYHLRVHASERRRQTDSPRERRLSIGRQLNEGSREPQPTPAIERVIQAATVHALSSGSDVVNGVDALLAIWEQDSSQALQFLTDEGLTRLDLAAAISREP